MKVIEVIIKGLSIEEREVVNALLEAEGYEGFWLDGDLFKAYAEVELFDDTYIDQLLNNHTQNASFQAHPLKDHNWNQLWEENFQPVIINEEWCIRAPFHPPQEGMENEIIIEPQMSFGTGHHQTTSLMARYLINLSLKNTNVLDMGCGTGVLAIIASRLGASEITAIDIEQNACENTLHNLHLNQIEQVVVLQGDASVIPDASYDLIAANINKNCLLQDVSVYASHLKDKGVLLLSGFFETDEEDILPVTSKNSLYLLDIKRNESWSMIAVEKRIT